MKVVRHGCCNSASAASVLNANVASDFMVLQTESNAFEEYALQILFFVVDVRADYVELSYVCAPTHTTVLFLTTDVDPRHCRYVLL